MISLQRNRILYLVLILIVIFLGLASRRFSSPPDFMYMYVGDALSALMVFLIFAFLFPLQSTIHIALFALCFTYAIEFSQLYHAPWIDMIRHNRLGGLVLGFVFLWSDLVSYIVGISAGVLAEHTSRRAIMRPDHA